MYKLQIKCFPKCFLEMQSLLVLIHIARKDVCPQKVHSFKTIILKQKLSFFKRRLNTQLKSVISAEERAILLAKQKLSCDLPNRLCGVVKFFPVLRHMKDCVTTFKA